MANNYSQFSEQIDDLPPEAEKWAHKILEMRLEDVEDEEAALAFLKDELGDVDDLEYWPNFGWMIESNLKDSGDTHSIWLYSDEGCDFNHVMSFVQALIRKFMPDYIFSLTNSDTCSKLRIGEFGGGWMVISKDQVLGGTTWGAAEAAVEALRTGNHGPEVDDG